MVQPLLLLPLLGGVAVAQKNVGATTQSLYGQCGGQTWVGPVACPTGAYCKNDGNPWYSQCVAIDSGDSPLPGASVIQTRTLTTIFSVGGPNPTTVSTRITYLTPKPTTTVSITTITLVPDEPCTDENYC